MTDVTIQMNAVSLLRELEWKGRASYNNGVHPCCVCCGGIHPDYHHGWIKEAVGHRASCALNAILVEANNSTPRDETAV